MTMLKELRELGKSGPPASMELVWEAEDKARERGRAFGVGEPLVSFARYNAVGGAADSPNITVFAEQAGQDRKWRCSGVYRWGKRPDFPADWDGNGIPCEIVAEDEARRYLAARGIHDGFLDAMIAQATKDLEKALAAAEEESR